MVSPGTEGTPGPPSTRVMHHGLAMQRDAGQAALATGDGQWASKVVPVPALCSEAGPTTGAAQEVWRGLVDVAGEKTSKSSWETP